MTTDPASAETMAVAAEERYRAFIENSTEGIWRFDTDEPVPIDLPEEEQIDAFYRVGWLAEANDAFARMYGYERGEELVGARLGDLIPRDVPENVDYLRAFVRSRYHLSGAESVETDRDGNLRHFSNTLTGVVEEGRLVRVWGTQRDITELIASTEALRASEERYRELFEDHPQPMWVWDVETGELLAVNPAALALHGGYTREEFLHLHIDDLHSPEEVPRFREAMRALARQPHGSTGVWRHLRKDGTEMDLEVTAGFARWGGRPARVVAARDVTERVAAERARLEVEERLSLALASGGLGAWDADLRAGTLALSEEIPPLYGRPRRALTISLSEWMDSWLHPGDKERISQAFDAALRGEAPYDVRFRSLWPDGTTSRWIATSALISRDPKGAPLRAVGYTRNVTSEVEREAEREAMLLRQRQFMRDLVSSLTEGKFRLCLSQPDLPTELPRASEVVPLDLTTLRLLRHYVRSVAEHLRLPKERAFDFITAVGEASMNAHVHGRGGEGWVCADEEHGVIQVWVQDQGGGISEEALPRVLEKGVSTAGTLGHGFSLILKTADRIWLLTGPSGTTVVLEQERQPADPFWLQAFG